LSIASLQSLPSNVLIGLLGLSLVVVGIVVSVFLTFSNQDIRQQAQVYNSCSAQSVTECVGKSPGESCSENGRCETGNTGKCSCVKQAITAAPTQIVCTPGTSRCIGNNRYFCDYSGNGENVIACQYGCESGNCTPQPTNAPPSSTCKAGGVRCSGGILYTCTSTGAENSLRCESGQCDSTGTKCAPLSVILSTPKPANPLVPILTKTPQSIGVAPTQAPVVPLIYPSITQSRCVHDGQCSDGKVCKEVAVGIKDCAYQNLTPSIQCTSNADCLSNSNYCNPSTRFCSTPTSTVVQATGETQELYICMKKSDGHCLSGAWMDINDQEAVQQALLNYYRINPDEAIGLGTDTYEGLIAFQGSAQAAQFANDMSTDAALEILLLSEANSTSTLASGIDLVRPQVALQSVAENTESQFMHSVAGFIPNIFLDAPFFGPRTLADSFAIAGNQSVGTQEERLAASLLELSGLLSIIPTSNRLFFCEGLTQAQIEAGYCNIGSEGAGARFEDAFAVGLTAASVGPDLNDLARPWLVNGITNLRPLGNLFPNTPTAGGSVFDVLPSSDSTGIFFEGLDYAQRVQAFINNFKSPNLTPYQLISNQNIDLETLNTAPFENIEGFEVNQLYSMIKNSEGDVVFLNFYPDTQTRLYSSAQNLAMQTLQNVSEAGNTVYYFESMAELSAYNNLPAEIPNLFVGTHGSPQGFLDLPTDSGGSATLQDLLNASGVTHTTGGCTIYVHACWGGAAATEMASILNQTGNPYELYGPLNMASIYPRPSTVIPGSIESFGYISQGGFAELNLVNPFVHISIPAGGIVDNNATNPVWLPDLNETNQVPAVIVPTDP